MAFVNKDVIAGRGIELPIGHSQTTTVPAINGVDIREQKVLTIPCSGVVAATSALGIDALFTAIGTAVDTVIGTDFGIDTAGNSVDYIFIVNSIKEETTQSLYLNDATRNYSVVGSLSVKVY